MVPPRWVRNDPGDTVLGLSQRKEGLLGGERKGRGGPETLSSGGRWQQQAGGQRAARRRRDEPLLSSNMRDVRPFVWTPDPRPPHSHRILRL